MQKVALDRHRPLVDFDILDPAKRKNYSKNSACMGTAVMMKMMSQRSNP